MRRDVVSQEIAIAPGGTPAPVSTALAAARKAQMVDEAVVLDATTEALL